jgi:4-amino-4-deoxy-L-arabinose transferase-like glycosyltransferase
MTAARIALHRIVLFGVAGAMSTRLATLGLYPVMDTTEARYAEIARKMVELGDWITPWHDYATPFWGKPPLSIWLTAGSFRMFGESEFAARLPHFLCALLVIALIWDWSRRRSPREAALAAGLLVGSALFFVAAAAVMTDMTLTLGTTLAMRGFWLGLHGSDRERRRERWLLFLGLGIGLLAKGPVAMVFVGLPIAAWAIATGAFTRILRSLPWLRGTLLMLLLTVPWYLAAEYRTPGFLEYFLIGEHWKRFLVPGWTGDLYGSAHAYPWGSVWLFAVVACLPWSLILPLAAIAGRRGATHAAEPPDRALTLYLLLWGLTPCVFFSAARNILWTYVLPGLPALSLLGAIWLARRFDFTRVAGVVAVGLWAMPIALCAFLVYLQHPGARDPGWAKALVADFLSQRANDESLLFLGNGSDSVAFYSKGHVTNVPDAARLALELARGPVFVAIREDEFPALPAQLKHRLTPVAHHGSVGLFRAAPAAETR